MDVRTYSLPEYVAYALTHVVGSPISLSDARGPSTEYKFILEGVPNHVCLGDITRHIAEHKEVGATMMTLSNFHGHRTYKATVCRGGRARVPHETISMRRTQRGQVSVRIKPLVRASK